MSDINNLQVNKKQELRSVFEQINQEEMRNAYSLKEHHDFDQKQAEYYSLKAAQQESVKIHSLLDNAASLDLTEEETDSLVLRENRNQNFLLINNEKWGGDSEFMRDIKIRIKLYEAGLRQDSMALAGAGEGFVQKDNVTKAKEAVSEVQQIIEACNTYLKRGPSFFFWRRGRYNAVLATKERFEQEKKILEKMTDTEKDIFKSTQKDELEAEINAQKDLLSAMENRTKLKKNVDKKHTERVRKENEEVKELAAKPAKYLETHNKNKDLLQEKVGNIRSRTAMQGAVSLKLLCNTSDEEMVENYKTLAPEFDECTKEQKTKKLRMAERIFKEILSYDINKFNFGSLKDLFGPNAMKNIAMCYLAMDSDKLIEQYKKLAQNNDPDVVLTVDQVKEVEARANAMRSVSTFIDSTAAIFNTAAGISVDVEKFLTFSLDQIEELNDK